MQQGVSVCCTCGRGALCSGLLSQLDNVGYFVVVWLWPPGLSGLWNTAMANQIWLGPSGTVYQWTPRHWLITSWLLGSVSQSGYSYLCVNRYMLCLSYDRFHYKIIRNDGCHSYRHKWELEKNPLILSAHQTQSRNNVTPTTFASVLYLSSAQYSYQWMVIFLWGKYLQGRGEMERYFLIGCNKAVEIYTIKHNATRLIWLSLKGCADRMGRLVLALWIPHCGPHFNTSFILGH